MLHRRVFQCFAFGILSSVLCTRAPAVDENSDSSLCVKWADEETAKLMQSSLPPELSAIGCTLEWTSSVVPRWSSLICPQGNVDLAIAVAAHLPQVSAAEKDPFVHPCAIEPNDPLWPQQKQHLSTICITGAWASQATSDRLIAVIDSGVRYDLPDLAPNMWRNPLEAPGQPGVDDDGNGIVDDIWGASFVKQRQHDCDLLRTPFSANDPTDRCGHGTGVASILGAVGDNSLGMAGIAWKCQILPVKIWGEAPGTASDATRGLEYAYRKGARLMNCSWTVGANSGMLHDFIHTTGDALYVVAAGNGQLDLDDPQLLARWYPQQWGDDNILVVGNASGPQHDNLGTSNFGLGSVDLFAPGDNMVALDHNGATQVFSGSSAAALLWTAKPALTPTLVRQYLMNAVDPMPFFQGFCVTGGRLNAARALGGLCN